MTVLPSQEGVRTESGEIGPGEVDDQAVEAWFLERPEMQRRRVHISPSWLMAGGLVAVVVGTGVWFRPQGYNVADVLALAVPMLLLGVVLWSCWVTFRGLFRTTG